MSEATQQKQSGRRENRIAAMQFLYMFESNRNDNLQDTLAIFFESKEEPREFYAFAEELIAGAISHLKEIDSAISNSAKNWSLDRIAKVDLAILRLAIFELLYRNDIPPVVSINEAIDIAKTFAGAESRRFVNGILDNIKGSLKRPLRTANK